MTALALDLAGAFLCLSLLGAGLALGTVALSVETFTGWEVHL